MSAKPIIPIKITGQLLTATEFNAIVDFFAGKPDPAEVTPIAHVGAGATAHANVVAAGAAGFMTGTDKTKLDGVAAGATNYTHPATHPPSIITQDVSNRFVTDTEKSTWNAKLDSSQKGANSGVAELDSGGKVPTSQLPSYVDDVTSYANFAGLPVTGESGKIYVTEDTNITYRWSGTAYVEISASLAIGSTGATAHRGDHGATAYTHSQDITTNPHAVTKSQVGLGSVDNTADSEKEVSTPQLTALNFKANSASPIFTGTVTVPIIVSTAVVRLKGYTVATLPVGVQGDTAYCTDLLAPAFLATVMGGGAVVGPVFFDGASWKSH